MSLSVWTMLKCMFKRPVRGSTRSRPLAADPSAQPHLELRINSDPVNVCQVRRQLEEFAQTAGMPEPAYHALGLVVNEALANTIRHGYAGATDQPILIQADAVKHELRVSIRDWARPFDPNKVEPKPAGEITPGGLGLMCIRRLMDESHYEALPDGMRLTLVKRWS